MSEGKKFSLVMESVKPFKGSIAQDSEEFIFNSSGELIALLKKMNAVSEDAKEVPEESTEEIKFESTAELKEEEETTEKEEAEKKPVNWREFAAKAKTEKTGKSEKGKSKKKLQRKAEKEKKRKEKKEKLK
jgi:hypothetical protein